MLRTLANTLYWNASGRNSRPVIYDIDQVCPELRELEENWQVIRDELDAVLPHREDIPRYHEIDPERSHISDESDNGWRILLLYAMGIKPEGNRAMCPKTVALLDKIPNLFQATFSILEPHKSVPAHSTPYWGYLRYHLPMIVPKQNPPWMRVKDQEVHWKEGEGVLFCDAWDHEVYNNCDEVRVVLMVDILRPMRWFADRLNRFITNTVIRNGYARKIGNKNNSFG